MKLQRHLLSTLCLLFITSIGFSQHRNCGTMEHLQMQESIDQKRLDKLQRIERHTQGVLANTQRMVDGVITIPVVFHVVYNGAAENISDAQINSQMTVINDDFRRTNSDANNTWSQAADTEIQFCLASVDPNGQPTTGITRTSTTRTSFGTNDAVKSTSTGGVNAWPADQYLNIWICDIGGGILGYAQFPGGNPATDGVVNDYRYTGTVGAATAPFDLGRTLTHEIGHYLNLRHIWGDGNCNADDFVTDTPASDGANYGCATGHISCSSVDMVQNYMDYSDDACMNLFTAGQTARMRAIFEPGGARESLLSSSACGPAGPPTCDDGFQNGNETGVDCGGPDCPDCPTCDDGIQNGNETGTDCGGPDCNSCPCTGTEVTITINLDNYPEETSWALTTSGGATVASGGTYANLADGSTFTESVCLPDGCYTFTINDSYGDGICCQYGSGSYSVTDATGTLASGASFNSSESTDFCFSDGPAPTCNDGIQNGNETGIDCGGPDCDPCDTCNDGIQNGNETEIDCGGPDCDPCDTCNDGIQNGNETDVDCGGPDCDACPTCNDGIQNGNETDVDCGGPDCDACPTCNDGIQNGNETGIDCGGPDCDPCDTGECSEVTIDANDFESSLGIWNDGGSDCRRNIRDQAYANSGNYCVRLRDNTSSSVLTSDILDLSSFEEITIDFNFVGVSMETNEDLWVRISNNGGSSYTTIADYDSGTDFNNNTREFETITIQGPFTANTRLQFRCDASVNQDRVYLDDIVLSGCANSLREIENPLEQIAEENSRANPIIENLTAVISSMQVYPNPASDKLTVTYNLNTESAVQLLVTDFAGRTVHAQRVDQTSGDQKTDLDVSNLDSGFYFIQLITKDTRQTKKFVIVE